MTLSSGVSKRFNGKSKVKTAEVQRTDLDCRSRMYSSDSYCQYYFQVFPGTGIVWMFFTDPLDGSRAIVTDSQNHHKVINKVKKKSDVNLKRPIKVGRVKDRVWEPYPNLPITDKQLENCKRFVLSSKVVEKTLRAYIPLPDDSIRFPYREPKKLSYKPEIR